MRKPQSKRQEPTPLADRIKRARMDGRTQQALELTRQLVKHEPTESHRDLLRDVLLERGQQLLSQGYQKDAAQVFENAATLGGPPEFVEKLAHQLASLGSIDQALKLLDAQSPSRVKLVARAVDFAIRKGHAGRESLPEDSRPQFDLALQAFRHVESGQDEEARAALQGIGLQSPLLEWKVFLRGLLAYYQRDDARANENWRRLDTGRLPVQLAAPLRAQIDPEFRESQTPAAATKLHEQYFRLQGPSLLAELKNIQACLAQSESLATAFRHADRVLPLLRKDAPHLVPRLAACFREALYESSVPEDVGRYRRTFGDFPDDPHGSRLLALAHERHGALDEAMQFWQAYDRDIVQKPELWPSGAANRVRAMIWEHLGILAGSARSNREMESFEDFFPFGRPRRKTKQSAKSLSSKVCFSKSLELAPDRLSTHQALFDYLLDEERVDEAKKAGDKLLERFPDHLPTLEELARLALEKSEFMAAVEYLERALKANPLRRELREKLSRAYACRARELTVAKGFDEARAKTDAALNFQETPPRFPLFCLRSALELKAKDSATSEEFLKKAEAEADHPAAVAYAMVCESIRLSLTAAQKKDFKAKFDQALEQPLTPQACWLLVQQMIRQKDAGARFHGQLTYEKKIQAVLKKYNLPKTATEEDFERLCKALQKFDDPKGVLWKHFLDQGLKKFRNNPQLLLHEIAIYHIVLNKILPWRLGDKFQRVRGLIDELPRGVRQQELLDELQNLQEFSNEFGAMDSFFGGFEDMFGGMFGAEDDEEDYD